MKLHAEAFDMLQFVLYRHMSHNDLGSALACARDIYILKTAEYANHNQLRLSQRKLCLLVREMDPDAQQFQSSYRACLSISLLVHLLALLANHENAIVIGVARDSGKLHSHAWVEFADGERADMGNQAGGFDPICRISLRTLERL